MSTRIRRALSQFLTAATLLIFIVWTGGATAEAQVNKVTIRVNADVQSHISVEAECAPTSVWLFRDSYAGIIGLGSRVKSLKAFAASGAEVTVRQIAPGQFESNAAAVQFVYELNIVPPLNPLDVRSVDAL